jgi:superfamily II DNA or RNA helicase
MAKTKEELQAELQADALSNIGNQYGVSVEIGTGGGKTLLGLKHMVKQYSDTSAFLVLASKKSIFTDWKNEMKKHNMEFLLDHVIFSTYRSLNKQPLDYDWVYADECHSFTVNHTSWLNSYELSNGKLLGLTGTYPKSGDKKAVCDTYCPRIYQYHIDEAIDNGMLNDYVIWVHLLKLDRRTTYWKSNKNGSKWKTSEYKDYHGLTASIDDTASAMKKKMLRIFRMKSMMKYPSKDRYVAKILNKIPKKALIFANSQAQADAICKHSYHSANKDSEKNLDLFANDMIYRLSCVEQLSEGKNIPNLQVAIIQHTFNDEKKTRQRIGRMFRLSPDKTAYIHILCYEDSIDKRWVANALSSYDQSKIKYYRPK